MPTPQFDGIHLGFDSAATPRWAMVGLNNPYASTQTVWLVNAWLQDDVDGLIVRSVNPRIATIADDNRFKITDERYFEITEISPGVTFIEVFDTTRRAFVTRLEVEVKDKKTLKIAYHLVDSGISKTNRDSNILGDLNVDLNDLFGLQANINFDMTRGVWVQASTDLLSIVREQKDDSRRKGHAEWDRLVAEGDPTADINVFFMSWDGPREKRPSQMIVRESDIVCVDDMNGLSTEELERALGHEIARRLGCEVTYDDRQRDHLMFRSPDQRGGSFIPKDCANLMNPTHK